MNAIVAVKKEIRRALEIPLFNLCDAQDPKIPIMWGHLPKDTVDAVASAPLERYVAAAVGFGPVTILEVGPQPRFQGNGALTMVIRTPAKLGADVNDDLAKLIVGAYPYGSAQVFDGVTVYIDKADTGAYGVDRAWLYSEVAVLWTSYRR